MCGIIGIFGPLPNKNIVKKSTDALKYRGPDNKGLYYDADKNIALGHRRLSIIDLSAAGRQPFFSNDEKFVIVFNGEIYNYIEIKEQLKKFYTFRTKTDTEVLLASYIKWGEKGLEKLNGMFAFAIWNSQTRTLFCARDRLGEKPFYYHYNPSKNTFYFASEIKALLKLGINNDPDENTIYEYLYYGFYHHSEKTFFKNIKELKGGHFLIQNQNGLTIKKYWDLADIKKGPEEISKEEAEEKFKELLVDSIKLRFRSDVPVGINLSSGLDSNTLLYYSKIVTKNDIHTFSMCSNDETYNECSLIENFLNPEQVAKWHTYYFEPNKVFEIAEKINLIQDQPYGGIPTIMYAGLIEKAKEAGIIVLLEGQGLDELLGGYKYYKMELQKDLGETNDKEFASLDYSQDMSKLIDRRILSKDFTEQHRASVLNFKSPFSSHLLNAQYRDIVYAKLPRVLHFNDHATMAYGRELRLPFLDHRLVEFCFFLPPRFKISGDEQKVLVRSAMKNILPHVVHSKPKVTYGAIQTDWLRKYFKDQVYSIISSESFKKRPYWDHNKLKDQVDLFYKKGADNSFFIWQCINLEMWVKKYVD